MSCSSRRGGGGGDVCQSLVIVSPNSPRLNELELFII